MADGEDIDREDIILHAIDNAIIAYSYPITRAPFKLLIPVGSGVGRQFF